jgi:lipoprotein-releasing system permease protein
MINKQDRQGNTFYTRSIKELNLMIFNWLDVLDVNVVVILILVMAVAGFTMISGLLIIILERIQMIGILKALGQENRSLRSVFLYISFFLIGKGMIWGNVIALIICFVQYYFRLIKLNPSDYYIDAVPIDLSFTHWLLINVGALTISLLMMLLPSYLITKVNPARSIRFE